jgi:mannose-6-phosphate isomerase-like protein (cupin superfamily)
MARAGDVLHNPVTGERITFLKTGRQTDNRIWQAEFFVPPGGGLAPVAHVHPFEEHFEILEGRARYVEGRVERSCVIGHAFTTPVGVPHKHPWNSGSTPMRYRQTIQFATPDPEGMRKVDIFFETLYGLARDGKVGKDGVPRPLQFAVILDAFRPYAIVAGIPGPIERLLVGALASIGRATGARFEYERYSGGVVAEL